MLQRYVILRNLWMEGGKLEGIYAIFMVSLIAYRYQYHRGVCQPGESEVLRSVCKHVAFVALKSNEGNSDSELKWVVYSHQFC